jgi:hypothetical protein
LQLWSDSTFAGPALRDARYLAFTGSDVYLYSFDFLNPRALPDIRDQQLRGVPHGWE